MITNPGETFTTLRCDPAKVATHPHRQLIVDYSPILVIFPEDPKSPPPYPDSATDYFPRPVDVYLDSAKLVAPRLINTKSTPLRWGALKVNDWWDRIRRLFGISPALRFQLELAKSIKAGQDGLRSYVLDSGPSDGADAWRGYHKILAKPGSSSRYPITGYVHVVSREDRLTIQYWYFYYFNDFWNRHQCDFELVGMHFKKDRSGTFAPTGCVYGSHRGGSFRLWDDVAVAPGTTQPLAYVARGSHAFYPRPKLEGWLPALTVSTPIPFFKIYFNIVPTEHGQEVREVVPMPLESLLSQHLANGQGYQYEIRIMPPEIDTVTPGNSDWKDWWWTRFEGGWGPANFTPHKFLTQPSIQSMSCQGRFKAPWQWLQDICIADSVGEWAQL